MSTPTAAPSAPAASTPSAPLTQAGSSPVIQADAGAPAPGAAADGVQATKAPEPPRTWELKINGKARKFNESELLARASQAEAAQERFNEAAKMRRQAEESLGRIRDPKRMIEALQDPSLGLTKDGIREAFEDWYAREFIDPETLTPEQKKIREYEAKIQKYADAEKTRDDEKRQAQEESMTTQAREQLQTQIIQVLETGGLPKTNFTIRRIAYWMQRNHANGFDAPAEVVVGQVRNEMNESLRELVEASDGDVLVKTLGESVIQKLRKYDLEQLKKMRGQPAAPVAEGGSPSPGQSKAPITSADVNERIRQMQRTGRY